CRHPSPPAHRGASPAEEGKDTPQSRPSSQWRSRATGGAPLRTAPVICNFAPMTLFGRQRGTTMRIGLTTAALTLIPTAAFAHPGIGDAHGFVHGFAHPLSGLGHTLAIVTVSIFAWLRCAHDLLLALSDI